MSSWHRRRNLADRAFENARRKNDAEPSRPAALDLFARYGFDATTTEQIAAAADISPRTFFSYFPTKEDVVLADYAQRLERILTELAARPDGERPWEALRASLLVVATDYEAEREQLMLRFSIMAQCPSVFARNLALQAGWESTSRPPWRGAWVPTPMTSHRD
ncbi:MAG: TetR/AcrR family transcriptional regulator [Microthrixaceae bacterium]|nr:TetR/AcrR family transcriptional regulator [Microthrixaceae bacterium]